MTITFPVLFDEKYRIEGEIGFGGGVNKAKQSI